MIHQQPRQPRAVLWDLDGTLINTAPIHWRAWKEILSAEGVDLTWEQFAPSFGERNDTALRAWLGPELSDEEIQRISNHKEELFRASLKNTSLEMLPGAKEWLARLHEAGWKQALATMTWRENLEAIFSASDFRDCFDVVVTAEDVRRGKPDPEVFLLAAQRLAVPPARCIVIEDAASGIEAAHQAGMHAIGAGKQTLLKADRVVLSLTDLTDKAFDDLVQP
jgi:beta-phosphoglucomutase family hydrolase